MTKRKREKFKLASKETIETFIKEHGKELNKYLEAPMRKRETFAETCKHCGRELTQLSSEHALTCQTPVCKAARAANKKYRGSYSLTEYRTAITGAYFHVTRQLAHGLHEQDKKDAADWLEKHGPLARALQIATNHGIK